ncbi:hypothetical protein Tco_0844523 [Tanacetum coccineum]
MNTTQPQQKAFDDALVAPADHFEFGKCNMRLKTDIKPKEATFQVVLDALALTPFYRAFLITADEDLLFQIENKDAKKTNKMSYPRFKQIIIDYFMSKDQSILKRNKMFWHIARDATMFTSIRCISRHEDTQVEKAPKLKYTQKKADSDTSPKKKPVQATKGTRLKSKAKVVKPDKKKQPAKKTKAKGLAVLSMVALTKAEPLKLATKRSKKEFHSSYTSGLGDSEDEDEDDENDSDNLSDEESRFLYWINLPYYSMKKKKNISDKETMYDDEDDEVTKELYQDVNVNLGSEDTEMTNVDQGATDQQNLLNLEIPYLADNEIVSLMETSARHATTVPENTSGFTTTVPPPPPFFNPLQQEATPTPTPITS